MYYIKLHSAYHNAVELPDMGVILYTTPDTPFLGKRKYTPYANNKQRNTPIHST